MALSSKFEKELCKVALHSPGNRVTVVLRSIFSYEYFVHAISGAVVSYNYHYINLKYV